MSQACLPLRIKKTNQGGAIVRPGVDSCMGLRSALFVGRKSETPHIYIYIYIIIHNPKQKTNKQKIQIEEKQEFKIKKKP